MTSRFPEGVGVCADGTGWSVSGDESGEADGNGAFWTTGWAIYPTGCVAYATGWVEYPPAESKQSPAGWVRVLRHKSAVLRLSFRDGEGIVVGGA